MREREKKKTVQDLHILGTNKQTSKISITAPKVHFMMEVINGLNDICTVTGQPWENKLNWIPDSAPATSRDHGIVNSALNPGTGRREKARTENQENEAPLSDPGANWTQDPRRDQCKGKLPLSQPTLQNSPLCNPPKRRRGLRSRRKEKVPLRGAN